MQLAASDSKILTSASNTSNQKFYRGAAKKQREPHGRQRHLWTGESEKTCFPLCFRHVRTLQMILILPAMPCCSELARRGKESIFTYRPESTSGIKIRLERTDKKKKKKAGTLCHIRYASFLMGRDPAASTRGERRIPQPKRHTSSSPSSWSIAAGYPPMPAWPTLRLAPPNLARTSIRGREFRD